MSAEHKKTWCEPMGPDSLSPSMFIGNFGGNVISFGSGQPDLPPPQEVFDALCGFRGYRYGLIQGQEPLREALAAKYKKEHPWVTAGSFVITNGASEALDMLLRIVSMRKSKKPGKILLSRPYYYSYAPLIKYAGLEPVYSDLVEGRFDFSDFEEKAHDCRAALINSPANPTGRVQTAATLRKIEKLTGDLGITVLSDDVYDELNYTQERYVMKGPHVVTINSFSKTFSMCGYRVGYFFTQDRNIIEDSIEMKSHTTMNTCIAGQEMALAALSLPRSYVTRNLKVWKERRDLIYKGLLSLGLELDKPEGAFYVLPKIKKPRHFVWDMYSRHDVITYLGEWFGAPDRVRFSYALDAEKIDEGLKRVGKYLRERGGK